MTRSGVQLGRLVVLRALGLGDLLTVVPALRGLRSAYPDRRIVLAAPAKLAALARLTGAIDAVLPTVELAPLRWSGPPPAVAVNLHGAGPESHRQLLALRPSCFMMGFRHPDLPDAGGPAWWPEEHEVRRWCRMVGTFGVPADPADLDLAVPGVGGRAEDLIVLHPGAKHGARRWPVERYGAVARALRAAGHRVVVTGSTGERSLAKAVAAEAGIRGGDVLAGNLSVLGLAELVGRAALVVSGDTGIAHLATAYRTPSVVLFGPTPPSLWGPPPDRPWHVALWHGDGIGDPFAAKPDPALLAITVDEVLAATSVARRTRVKGARSTP